MIPKTIHTFWLSGEEKPEQIQACWASAKEKNPSYTFRTWSIRDIRDAFPVIPAFFEEAITYRKWAFATDWARLAVLHKFGGIYIDGDVTCHKPFDSLLDSGGFIGWESSSLLGPHTIGAEPGHYILADWVSAYAERRFQIAENVLDQTPMPDIISNCSVKKHGLIRNGDCQILVGNFRILTADKLTSRIDEGCIAEHLYAGSWLPKQHQSFAVHLREENRRFLQQLRRTQKSPLRRRLVHLLPKANPEKAYQDRQVHDRKKSLALIGARGSTTPSVSFWHIGAAFKPSYSFGRTGDRPLISIIVPVYNVERFIERCLNSLTSQTYSKIEILLVDDGSTDSSPQICKQFASRDKRFRVFRKQNGGLGSARNFGIEHATGDALCFVDSDDFVSPDYVSNFVTGLTSGSDIVVCDHQHVLPDGRVLERRTTGTLFGEHDPAIHLLNTDAECFAWNKMFRREVFDFEKFRFGDGWFEDFAIMPAVISSARSISYTNACSYNYVQRPDSIISLTKSAPLKNLDIIASARKLISLQPVFKPNHWANYYDWKLIRHILYFRWGDLSSIEDQATRELALQSLARFLKSEVPWWHESEFVKARLRNGNFFQRVKERQFVREVLSWA